MKNITELIAEYKTKLLAETKHDPELAHITADRLLCELLEKLGCQEVVAAYQKIPRYYS